MRLEILIRPATPERTIDHKSEPPSIERLNKRFSMKVPKKISRQTLRLVWMSQASKKAKTIPWMKGSFKKSERLGDRDKPNQLIIRGRLTREKGRD